MCWVQGGIYCLTQASYGWVNMGPALGVSHSSPPGPQGPTLPAPWLPPLLGIPACLPLYYCCCFCSRSACYYRGVIREYSHAVEPQSDNMSGENIHHHPYSLRNNQLPTIQNITKIKLFSQLETEERSAQEWCSIPGEDTQMAQHNLQI